MTLCVFEVVPECVSPPLRSVRGCVFFVVSLRCRDVYRHAVEFLWRIKVHAPVKVCPLRPETDVCVCVCVCVWCTSRRSPCPQPLHDPTTGGVPGTPTLSSSSVSSAKRCLPRRCRGIAPVVLPLTLCVFLSFCLCVCLCACACVCACACACVCVGGVSSAEPGGECHAARTVPHQGLLKEPRAARVPGIQRRRARDFPGAGLLV